MAPQVACPGQAGAKQHQQNQVLDDMFAAHGERLVKSFPAG